VHNGQPSQISGAKGKALSGLERLLEITDLEIMAGLVHIHRPGGREFQTVRAAMLKLWEPIKCGQMGWRAYWYLTTQENE